MDEIAVWTITVTDKYYLSIHSRTLQSSLSLLKYARIHKQQLLASSSQDQHIKLGDADSGDLITTLNYHTDYVYAVSFHPSDAHVLASGGRDAKIHLYHLQIISDTHTKINPFAYIIRSINVKSCVCSLKWHPKDGNIIAAGTSSKHEIHIYHVNNSELIRVIKDHTALIDSIAYSDDGHLLISGSNYPCVECR